MAIRVESGGSMCVCAGRGGGHWIQGVKKKARWTLLGRVTQPQWPATA